jgi:hypothetical protein
VLRFGRQNQSSRVPVVWYSVRVPSLRTLTAVLVALMQQPKVEHKYQPMDTIMNHESVVGIATRYELDGTGFRAPVGARFPMPVQKGPDAEQAACKMGEAADVRRSPPTPFMHQGCE